MKMIDHTRRALPSVCACAVFLMFPLTIEGQSVSPGDYDGPVSTAQQMRLGATYNYAGSGTDVQTNDGSASLLYNREQRVLAEELIVMARLGEKSGGIDEHEAKVIRGIQKSPTMF